MTPSSKKKTQTQTEEKRRRRKEKKQTNMETISCECCCCALGHDIVEKFKMMVIDPWFTVRHQSWKSMRTMMKRNGDSNGLMSILIEDEGLDQQQVANIFSEFSRVLSWPKQMLLVVETSLKNEPVIRRVELSFETGTIFQSIARRSFLSSFTEISIISNVQPIDELLQECHGDQTISEQFSLAIEAALIFNSSQSVELSIGNTCKRTFHSSAIIPTLGESAPLIGRLFGGKEMMVSAITTVGDSTTMILSQEKHETILVMWIDGCLVNCGSEIHRIACDIVKGLIGNDFGESLPFGIGFKWTRSDCGLLIAVSCKSSETIQIDIQKSIKMAFENQSTSLKIIQQTTSASKIKFDCASSISSSICSILSTSPNPAFQKEVLRLLKIPIGPDGSIPLKLVETTIKQMIIQT